MPEYRVGDIIELRQTVKVDDVRSTELVVVGVGETARGLMFVDLTDPGLRIQMVKRAPDMHTGPKPEAGVVLRGRHIKRIWWKRGTIFRLHNAEVGGLVLREDAKLYPLSNVSDADGDRVFEFDDLADDARFDLVYVA